MIKETMEASNGGDRTHVSKAAADNATHQLVESLSLLGSLNQYHYAFECIEFLEIKK